MALIDPCISLRYQNIHETIKDRLGREVTGRGFGFSDLVVAHWAALYKKPYPLNLKGNATGMSFELIICDALVQWGVDPSFFIGQVKYKKYNAEIDCLLSRRPHQGKAVGLMMKTSLRERWKQADRDGIIWTANGTTPWDLVQKQHGLAHNDADTMTQSQLDLWLLTAREKESEAPEVAVDRMQRDNSKYHSIKMGQAISIYDTEAMERLLWACLAL